MAAIWLRTDEADDVTGSIRHAIRSYTDAADDPQAWKWVALAVHSALQGACICHLTTTAPPLGAVTPRNTKDWIAYYDESRLDPDVRPPRTQLMDLPCLLKAVRKPGSAGDRSNEGGIAINAGEFNWLRSFHESVRNQFVHFEPMGWSLEVSGIPAIAALAARIIGDITAVGWAFRHKDCAWIIALQSDLMQLAKIGRD